MVVCEVTPTSELRRMLSSSSDEDDEKDESGAPKAVDLRGR